MKNEQLLIALEQINEEYIASAASTICCPKSSKFNWFKFGIIAACFCLICGALIYLDLNQSSSTIEIDPDLPLLEVVFADDGMGFEGIMLYDISESDSNNPWSTEVSLKSLPVYKNLAYTNEAAAPVYLNEKSLKYLAEQTAAAFNEEILSFNSNYVDNQLYEIVASTENVLISVSGNGNTEIEYLHPLTLPVEYSFTSSNTSDAQAQETINYLTENYSSQFSFKSPIVSTWIDYTFTGNQDRTYAVYEQSDDITESILNYNFKSVSFIPNNQGKLWYIRINNLLSYTELIGEYPIITEEQAFRSLLDGNYFTTVPEEYLQNGKIRKKDVAKAELVYRTGNINEVFMPFYRFYVELSEVESEAMVDGLKNYGIYYVPAVSREYLEF